MQALSGSTAAWKSPSTPSKASARRCAVTDVAGLEPHAPARERVAEVRLARIEVEHDDLGGAGGQQAVDDVRADEAGAAGDEEPVDLGSACGRFLAGNSDGRAGATHAVSPATRRRARYQSARRERRATAAR